MKIYDKNINLGSYDNRIIIFFQNMKNSKNYFTLFYKII
jgi:hypothetical protein